MPSEGAELALVDIRENILLAQAFAGGLSFDQFMADRRTIYAVERCLEIISEASRRLPSAVRERHSELPWRAIMGVGNVYRHQYHEVVEEIVWRTLHHSLGALLKVVEDELARWSREP